MHVKLDSIPNLIVDRFEAISSRAFRNSSVFQQLHGFVYVFDVRVQDGLCDDLQC